MPHRMLRTDLVDELEELQRGCAGWARRCGGRWSSSGPAGCPGWQLAKDGREMKKQQGRTLGQMALAANTPMMLRAGLVEGDTDAGVLACGQVVGVIDDLPTLRGADRPDRHPGGRRAAPGGVVRRLRASTVVSRAAAPAPGALAAVVRRIARALDSGAPSTAREPRSTLVASTSGPEHGRCRCSRSPRSDTWPWACVLAALLITDDNQGAQIGLCAGSRALPAWSPWRPASRSTSGRRSTSGC